MKRTVTLVAIAILVSGCTTTVLTTEGNLGAGAPLVAAATTTVTVPPVAASVAPKATPSPTPKPTAVPVANDWLAFLKHETTSSGTMSTDIDKLTTDVTAGKSDRVILADADRVIADAHAEIAWLKANPPSACYKAVYTDIYNGTVETNNAMVALESYDLDTYMTGMDEATRLITSATDGISDAAAACAS